MKQIKTIITFLILGFSLSSLFLIYKFVEPDYSKQECEFITENFEKIKLGISKEEVLLLINSEPRNKIYPYSGVFSEQKNQWEIWLLCPKISSCVSGNLGGKKCYEWQMIAFNAKTEKVVKAFYDSPDRVGF